MAVKGQAVSTGVKGQIRGQARVDTGLKRDVANTKASTGTAGRGTTFGKPKPLAKVCWM